MIVDSSFLISLIIGDDELHKKAVEILEKRRGVKLEIPAPVLWETLTVLNYKKGVKLTVKIYNKKGAREKTEKIFNSLNQYKNVLFVEIDDNFFLEAIRFMFSRKLKISVVDAVVILLSIKEKKDLLTFDKEMIKIIKKLKNK